MVSLKEKAVTGLTWSFIDNFLRQFMEFFIGIVLARLLSPKEFGLIGMITIFIAVSNTFIDSGLRQALLRKKNCTNVELATVFYFNLSVSFMAESSVIIPLKSS